MVVLTADYSKEWMKPFVPSPRMNNSRLGPLDYIPQPISSLSQSLLYSNTALLMTVRPITESLTWISQELPWLSKTVIIPTISPMIIGAGSERLKCFYRAQETCMKSLITGYKRLSELESNQSPIGLHTSNNR